jgi:small subunit ribosomal protein S16
MLRIRLFRVGKKNQPAYKVVVTDRRKPPRAGRFVEQVGFYNPITKEKILKSERVKYWLSVGAQPSDTVHNLIVQEKIIEAKKIDVQKKSKKEVIEEVAEKSVSIPAKVMVEKEEKVEVKAEEKAIKKEIVEKVDKK